mmetsp:Transcript_38074/g.87793  ORF Transcript_38074/g.87793 Transcript_38074/m.87793 type:complete len:204 (+) Transcript_38074:746-1357(+)
MTIQLRGHSITVKSQSRPSATATFTASQRTWRVTRRRNMLNPNVCMNMGHSALSLPCSGRSEARKPLGASAALPEQIPHTTRPLAINPLVLRVSTSSRVGPVPLPPPTPAPAPPPTPLPPLPPPTPFASPLPPPNPLPSWWSDSPRRTANGSNPPSICNGFRLFPLCDLPSVSGTSCTCIFSRLSLCFSSHRSREVFSLEYAT